MALYNFEKVYRSIIYCISQIVPEGVIVVEGESYGVRFDDPRGKAPSVAVTIDDIHDQPIELGSFSTGYSLVFTINAASRFQRDALKAIVYSGLRYNSIAVYSDFVENTPASGAVIEESLVPDNVRIRDMPNFSTDREKFFWTSVCFATLDVLD